MVVGGRAEFHRVEDVHVDSVVVPVLDSTAERAGEARREDFDSRFDQPPCEQQLLAPLIAAVTITHTRVFAIQIECFFRFRIGQQRHRLRLELIECGEFSLLIEGSFERVEILP